MVTVKEKYGFLPTSILHFRKDKRWTRAIADKGSVRNDVTSVAQSLYSNFGGGKNAPPVSEFNPQLAEFCVQYWSESDDVVLDPFMGRYTRCFVVSRLDRKYIGYDISPDAIKFVRDMVAQPQLQRFKYEPTIIRGNGCVLLGVENDSVDMIFSCPPYHNIERYENVPGQLSDISNYNDFLDLYSKCMSRCYDVLKDGKYVVFVVGNWRVSGELINFAGDTINLFKDAGFRLHDEVIHKLDSLTKLGIGKYEQCQFVAKCHEHVLVFKKV